MADYRELVEEARDIAKSLDLKAGYAEVRRQALAEAERRGYLLRDAVPLAAYVYDIMSKGERHGRKVGQVQGQAGEVPAAS